MMVKFTFALLFAAGLVAAQVATDDSADLRNAAIRGKVSKVEKELADGAAVDGADKNGRTALMLAAQRGREDVVTLLLSKGAKADRRDKNGYTAWGLARFDPIGHGMHQATLNALPKPPKPRVVINVGWTPLQLISTCFMKAGDQVGGVGKLQLDRVVLDQVARYAEVSGKDLLDIVHIDERGMNAALTADGVAPPEARDAAAVVNIQVQPGAACSGSTDSLNLGIDIRIFRVSDRGLLLGKTFAGGIKGLRTQPVDNPTQYLPVYLNWIKPSIEPMYWAIAEALYRAQL